MQVGKAYYIILEDAVLLSKKEYGGWREMQDEYQAKYKTNFPAMSLDDLLQYFLEDFKEEANWPFSKKQIEDFYNGEELVLYSARP